MKKIKTAYFSNTDFSLYNFRKELMVEMKNKGFEVFAVGPKTNEYFSERIKERGLKFIELPMRPGIDFWGRDLVYFFRVFFLCKREKFYLCHNFTIKPCIFASLAQRLAGVKNIYCTITGLGYAFEKNGVLNKLTINLYKISFKYIKKVIFQNQEDRELFINLKIIKKEKTELIKSSGVDTEYFKKEKIKKTKIFKGINVVLVARMLWSKGIKEFKEAAQFLKSKYPNLNFLLVGPIDKGNPSRIKEEELKKWKEVKYLGPRDDVREILAVSDIVVLPSYREGVSRVLLEAGSMEKPLITTNVPGCKETVVDGQNGFLVESRNSQELAKKIEILVNDPELREKFGKKSREIIEKEFNVQKIVKETIEVYDV
jgi:N,N'-diacetylbacillosaminyl-diphospho-undecaprenol alpha-1,3-N-acetylgalactosaminyltransferase